MLGNGTFHIIFVLQSIKVQASCYRILIIDVRIGKWYTVKAKAGQITMEVIEDRLKRADPVVLAYDIETSKSPLKFPDAAVDSIMMISYMIDGQVHPISL
jgi:DNA polymerase elongation subunit (family B)